MRHENLDVIMVLGSTVKVSLVKYSSPRKKKFVLSFLFYDFLQMKKWTLDWASFHNWRLLFFGGWINQGFPIDFTFGVK